MTVQTASDLMTAASVAAYGSASEVLKIEQVPKPVPGPLEILVRVRAAGVDPSVWHLMTGRPYLVRLMGFGLGRPKKTGAGADFAGIVEAVGADVAGFATGDSVFGIAGGSLAEFAVAPASKVTVMPKNLDFSAAAAVPISGLTALQGLRDVGKVKSGQKVVIIGAGGGVGSFAVQIAVSYGAEVTAVCSTAKVDLVRSLGAHHVIDYTREDIAAGGHGYDLILDCSGRRSLRILRRLLAKKGTLVLVGGEGGGKWLGGFQRQLYALLLSPFVSQSLRPMLSTENREDLDVLRSHIEAKKVTPAIDRTYPLNEAAAAIDYVASGATQGKVVVTI